MVEEGEYLGCGGGGWVIQALVEGGGNLGCGRGGGEVIWAVIKTGGWFGLWRTEVGVGDSLGCGRERGEGLECHTTLE